MKVELEISNPDIVIHGPNKPDVEQYELLIHNVMKGDKGDSGSVDDVKVNGTSVVVNRVADVSVPTMLAQLSSDQDNQRVSLSEKSVWNSKADKSDVNAINEKIPSQASLSNQLADKNFVNSSIATNTAHYISDDGQPFTSPDDLPTDGVTNNDYAFVTGTDGQGNTFYDRYKATVTGTTVTWAKEYRLNNSSFTAAQWAAISSGVTSGLVAKLGALPTAEELAIALLGKQETLISGTNIKTINGNSLLGSGNITIENKLFIAEYGNTSWDDVYAAVVAEKSIIVKEYDSDDDEYIYVPVSYSVSNVSSDEDIILVGVLGSLLKFYNITASTSSWSVENEFLQRKLTAGTGITISGNTISTKTWIGTLEEYNAISEKSNDTIYFIK